MCIRDRYSIDRFRMDKYLLLTRRVFFNQLKYLQSRNWNAKLVEQYCQGVLVDLPLSGDAKVYSGIPFHIIDILLDEWERLLTDKDDEHDDEEKETDEVDIVIAVKETPLNNFIKIFYGLVSNVNNSKILRTKIKEDLLADPRLIEWGIIENTDEGKSEEIDEPSSEDEEKATGEEEEWKGF